MRDRFEMQLKVAAIANDKPTLEALRRLRPGLFDSLIKKYDPKNKRAPIRGTLEYSDREKKRMTYTEIAQAKRRLELE